MYKKMGLKRVINAWTHATSLGCSIMPPEVVEAMGEASKSFVVVSELKNKASELIAKITGAEAGYVTSGAAAGIAIATAACITGTNLAKIKRLPDTEGMKNEIIVQQAHMNFYTHMIRMAGAKLVVVGNIGFLPWQYGWTTLEQIEGSITEKTAAIFHFTSLISPADAIPLKDILPIAKKHNLPVIVDAACDPDLRRYISMSADLVIFSGGKWFKGPGCSGFICGKKNLIQSCEMQERGIGRPMKIAKEEIIALMKALELYVKRDIQAEKNAKNVKIQYLFDQLKDLPNVQVAKLKKDQVDKEFSISNPTLQLTLDEEALGMTATEVHYKLVAGDPSIFLNFTLMNIGILQIDTSLLFDGEEQIIAKRLKEVLTQSDNK